jgi:hypothetical protein
MTESLSLWPVGGDKSGPLLILVNKPPHHTKNSAVTEEHMAAVSALHRKAYQPLSQSSTDTELISQKKDIKWNHKKNAVQPGIGGHGSNPRYLRGRNQEDRSVV